MVACNYFLFLSWDTWCYLFAFCISLQSEYSYCSDIALIVFSESLSPVSEVYQIDLVPTLAVLLGTAIPQNSLGVLIPEPLLSLPLRTQLQAWYRNSQQLLKVYQENVPDYDRSTCLWYSDEFMIIIGQLWYFCMSIGIGNWLIGMNTLIYKFVVFIDLPNWV